MVGDREGVHAEFLDVRDEFLDPVGAVEERELAVGMQMDEGHSTFGLRALNPGDEGCEVRGAESGVPVATDDLGCARGIWERRS